jgi:hypothetical protein
MYSTIPIHWNIKSAPAKAEVVLGQLSRYLASWGCLVDMAWGTQITPEHTQQQSMDSKGKPRKKN